MKHIRKEVESVALCESQSIVLNIKIPDGKVDNGWVLFYEILVCRETLHTPLINSEQQYSASARYLE